MPKLILIANRLPITIERKEGNCLYSPSVGGLATGMSALSKEYDNVWIGYSGIPSDNLDEKESSQINQKLISEYKCYPVELNNYDIKMYYNGFSNKTIWPLFHYFPVYAEYDLKTWESYKNVNEKFFEKYTEIADPDDTVWIHDYHLMLLPKLIRDKYPGKRIGFFLHIPFPSYEIIRNLPWREEILQGLLGADLIGFHTHSYLQHFLISVRRILGLENTFGYINTGIRMINTDAFPMGIDYRKYSDYLNNSQAKKEIQRIQNNVGKRKIILSIDRLDYTKGIVERLEAFDLFLEKYPTWREKVVLVMVTVPSRTKVETYGNLKSRVDELIGKINGKYDTIGWSPIRYIYRSLPFPSLIALYSLADTALVTPLRDGMNLVAKEYVAARTRKDGVLILSEMAGVAEELGEAMIVNPHNTEAMADALSRSLSMPAGEQTERMKAMQDRVKRNDVFKWAAGFIEKLMETEQLQIKSMPMLLDDGEKESLIDSYRQSKKRIIFLDYDGTLVPFQDNPAEAKPDRKLLNLLKDMVSRNVFKYFRGEKDILGILKKFLKSESCEIVIISGRDRNFLEKWFGNSRFTLVAEHGVWIKERNSDWRTAANLNSDWKKEIRPILEMAVDRTPGSFVEEKDFSLAWHYRKANPKIAAERAGEVKDILLHVIANLNLGILEGNQVIEVKNSEVSKGKAATYLISRSKYDFIMGIGDDVTDEDVFAVLPETAYSVKVGLTNSKAKFMVESFTEVRELLKELGR